MFKHFVIAIGFGAALTTAACIGSTESEPIEDGVETPSLETTALSQCSYIRGQSCTYTVTPQVRCQSAPGEYSTCTCKADNTMRCF
jgi:hypothetical protein